MGGLVATAAMVATAEEVRLTDVMDVADVTLPVARMVILVTEGGLNINRRMSFFGEKECVYPDLDQLGREIINAFFAT